MKGRPLALKDLPVGKLGQISYISGDNYSKRRFLDLGLTPNTIVKTERLSPIGGDPIAYNIRGSIIALRKEEASNIFIKII